MIFQIIQLTVNENTLTYQVEVILIVRQILVTNFVVLQVFFSSKKGVHVANFLAA